MNTKKLFVIVLAIIMMLSTVTGCRNASEDGSDEISIITSTIYEHVDIEGNNNSGEQSSGDASSDETDATSSDNNTDANSSIIVEEPTITVNPEGNEIYGDGSKDSPYEDTPDANTQTVTTVSIPAGKSVFYNIYRVGGRIFTINDSNAYVVCDGKRYDAVGGKVSFVVIDALASDAVSFEIGNKGSSAATFTITFSDLTGSMANPTPVNKIADKVTTNLAKGDTVGTFYKYVAEKNGKIRFYFNATEKCEIRITNNSTPGTIQVFSGDDDLTDSIDDSVYEMELNVSKGDEIVIHIGIAKKGRNYPATTIEWYGKFI